MNVFKLYGGQEFVIPHKNLCATCQRSHSFELGDYIKNYDTSTDWEMLIVTNCPLAKSIETNESFIQAEKNEAVMNTEYWRIKGKHPIENDDVFLPIKHWYKPSYYTKEFYIENTTVNKCPFYLFDYRWYEMYLHSEKWQSKKEERQQIDGYCCQLCGTGRNLQCHHLTYETLFDEDMEDLLTVCKSCHQKLHKADIDRR